MKTAVQWHRWYEKECCPYAVDRTTVDEYADWLRMVPWKLFCTFTFAWKVSDLQANRIYVEFINRLERALKSDVGYVRGDEKRISGCGMPACGRHFHALLTSAAPLVPSDIEQRWMSMAGKRYDGAGAKVEPYDPNRNGASYVLKFINREHGDWAFRKLHLFHPGARSLQTVNKRTRRLLRRHHARQQLSGCINWQVTV
jgi:hypothetical protein